MRVVEGVFDVEVRPPGSKSITNRAILLASLASGESVLRGALTDADDAQVMLSAVGRLGAKVAQTGDEARIVGVGGRWALDRGERAVLDLHNAGTATRFLSAAAMLAPEGTTIVIDGDARMRQRPIGELVDALRALGVDARTTGSPGCPPVEVRGMMGGSPEAAGDGQMDVRFGMTSSSQFISAVLLAAPFVPGGMVVRLPESPTSASYIDMTLRVLAAAGYDGATSRADVQGERVIEMAPRPLRGFAMEIEPDASGATYMEAAAAIVPGARAVIRGLDLHPSRPPLQGDTRFVGVLSSAGAAVQRLNRALGVIGPTRLVPIDVDLADMPDTAMTAAVVACFAEPTVVNPRARSVLHGLRTLRVKETDRLSALKAELSKIGARVEIVSEQWRGQADEALVIEPPTAEAMRAADAPRVEFETYHDHRMAMALSLVGLRRRNVWIRDPGCVAKTYAGYWRDLARVHGPA